MSKPIDEPPDTGRVEWTPAGDALQVRPPCHDRRVLLPADQAVPGAELDVVCPDGGEAWLLKLVVDEEAASGLRAVWTEADPGSTPGTGTDLEGDG